MPRAAFPAPATGPQKSPQADQTAPGPLAAIAAVAATLANDRQPAPVALSLPPVLRLNWIPALCRLLVIPTTAAPAPAPAPPPSLPHFKLMSAHFRNAGPRMLCCRYPLVLGFKGTAHDVVSSPLFVSVE